jgi:zinc/manganese transport system permease protein
MNLSGLDPVIIAPALAAGVLVSLTHVPLGQQVLRRGIIFIDLAIAQIAALGVLIAHTSGLGESGLAVQLTAFCSALLGAALLYQCERRWGHSLEAIIGVVFVLAATGSILLLANNPHAGEHLKDLLVGQILWVSLSQLLPVLVLYIAVLAAWYGLGAEQRPALFYVLFALTVTASVQLVGVYLVFAALIVPALAVRRLTRPCQSLFFGYLVSLLSFAIGLFLSAVFDWPSGAVIVWVLALLGVLVSLLARSSVGENAH